jgi:hypothetical protein
MQEENRSAIDLVNPMDAEEEYMGSPEIFNDEDFEESPNETIWENISEKKEPAEYWSDDDYVCTPNLPGQMHSDTSDSEDEKVRALFPKLMSHQINDFL